MAINFDGTRLFFGTRRPRPGETEDRQNGFDIWYANRSDKDWGDDDLGGGDLYVSFRSDDDTWSPPTNMGPDINSDKRDFCPMVTPDGKYLFFSSKRVGIGDIFWVDAGVIDTLR